MEKFAGLEEFYFIVSEPVVLVAMVRRVRGEGGGDNRRQD